ncbi:MAG TPA: copper homeostasis protein CutC, partial [Streptosporangiaceae bacterium]|nr:copper homeostasis protein CutC [Streptosporangiaceae bacterium]
VLVRLPGFECGSRPGAGAGGKVDRGWVQTFAQRSEGQDLMRVEAVDGVRVAARAGAARVEVCAGLSDGGLTPSAALSEAAAELAEVHVLVLQELARN